MIFQFFTVEKEVDTISLPLRQRPSHHPIRHHPICHHPIRHHPIQPEKEVESEVMCRVPLARATLQLYLDRANQ
jgi:hypothetical protein